MAKLRVGIIYGGRSVEHEVSVQSAASIAQALDPSRYEIQLLAVDPDGAEAPATTTDIQTSGPLKAHAKVDGDQEWARRS